MIHITRNPHDITGDKQFVARWAEVIVIAMHEGKPVRVLSPDEFIEARGGPEGKPEQGFIRYINSPLTKTKTEAGLCTELDTNKKSGRVVIHKFEMNDCPVCQGTFRALDNWWNPRMYSNEAGEHVAYTEKQMGQFAKRAREVGDELQKMIANIQAGKPAITKHVRKGG